MILPLAIAAGLADRCAPRVARETLLAVAYHESGLDTLAIGDNTARQTLHPRSRLEAAAMAEALIARGHNIDMGIGQINARTAPRLALTVSGAFDACQNLAAAGALMVQNYRKAARGGSAQRSLSIMLSMYNTGNGWRGFGNGYVQRVYRAAAIIVPRLGSTQRIDVDPGSIDPVLGGERQLSAVYPVAFPPGLKLLHASGSDRAGPPAWVAFDNPADVMVFADRPAGASTFNRKELLQ